MNITLLLLAVWAFSILFKIPTPLATAKYMFRKLVLFVKRCAGHATCQCRKNYNGLNLRCQCTTNQRSLSWMFGLNMCNLCLPSAASQILPSTKPGYDPVPNSEPDASTIGFRAAMSSTFNEMRADLWNVVTKLTQCSNQIKLKSMPAINAGTDAMTTVLYVLHQWFSFSPSGADGVQTSFPRSTLTFPTSSGAP